MLQVLEGASWFVAGGGWAVAAPALPAGRARADIAVIDSLAGFDALRGEWEDLFRRAAAPHQVFQSFDLLRHWAAVYLDRDCAPCIVVGRSGGRAAAIFPLVRRRRLGVETIEWMGAPIVQYGDCLVDPGVDPALLRACFDRICGLGADMLRLRNVRDDSAFVRHGLARGGTVTHSAAAPCADLAGRTQGGTPGPAYSGAERSGYRRRLRRLEARGAMSFFSLGPGVQAAAIARRAVEMKRDALRARSWMRPALADPRFAEFLSRFALSDGGAVSLVADGIALDGAPVGISVGLECKGRVHGFLLSAAPGFAAEGLGRVTVHRAFAGARARGNASFDMLAPADPYKLSHCDGQTGLRTLVFTLSVRGRVSLGLVDALARPLYRRLRAAAGKLRALLGRSARRR